MKEQQEEKVICHDCGKVIEPPDNFSTGYGIDQDGHKVCFNCCGKRDRKELFDAKPGDKFVFYLIEKKNETTGQTEYYVTNWPASLKIKLHATPRKGRHNIAGRRLDVWFIQNGKNFHGTQYGENSQLLYTKCVK
jgi:hypothetical protein